MLILSQYIKRILDLTKKILDLLVYYQIYLKSMKDVFIIKCTIFFEPMLSKYQCRFRKGHSAQHCLIVMVEKWKRGLDNNGVCGALLTDLFKAFDCLPHDLLIAKLHA